MDDAHFAEMADNIASLVASGRLAGKTIHAFGHCNATEKMIDLLLAAKIVPAAILDNNQSKLGLSYRGVKVEIPAAVQTMDGRNAVVLIASRAYAPMAAQLAGMRYGGEIYKIVDYNTFAEYSLSDETFARKRARAERGMRLLAGIKRRHAGCHLVVCPNNALGDVFLALAYLPEYCRRRGIADTVVTVTGNGCRQVAGLFGTERVVVADAAAMDELVQAVLFTREANCIIAHHDRPYTDNIIRYLDKRFLSFEDYYKVAVYGLPKDARPVAATAHARFSGADGMVKGKSVILSPRAKSVVELPAAFWEEYAHIFLADGFQVFTNVAGEEQAIAGTRPLRIPLDQMASAAEYAGTFVAIRSGLCEIVSGAQCRKVVIFPDCIYSTTGVKVWQYFALADWENRIFRETPRGHSGSYELTDAKRGSDIIGDAQVFGI